MNVVVSSSRRVVAAVIVALLCAAGLVFVGSPAADAADVPPTKAPLLQRDEDVVTADPLPTVQIDSGYVWAQTTVGNTVYAAGSFANARAALAAPGTNLTPRSNILAFDIRTGALLSFAPSVNGVIRAITASPDGSRIYIGGSFTQVNGQTRWNFAVLDAQTGALISGVSPAIGGSGVYGIAVTDSTIYVGGAFTQGNGVARKNLAAFSAANGTLLAWAPTTDLQVDALVMDPGNSHVIAAGRFYRVNDDVQRGLAALDPATGAVDGDWAASKAIINGWNSGDNAGKAGIFTLSTDASGVYGTGWVYADVSVGNLEGTFAADAGSGALRWVADCHGDHYGVYSTGEVVYSASHTHACETVDLWPELNPRQYRYVEAYTADARGTLTRSATAGGTYKDWSGTPSPSAYAWYPDFTVGTSSGLGQAGLSITGAGDFISIAGEFGSVNNQQYQGIVRFSTKPSTGANQGPRLNAATWSAPTAQSVTPGRVRVSVPANWDRDDKDLTYELLRDGESVPVAARTVSSGWWTQPTVLLTDTGLTGGSSQTYRVRVRDADGNTVTSNPVSVTVASGTASPYVDSVLDDLATLYYPMGSGNSDLAGTNPPTSNSVTNTSGGVVGSTATSATQFSGSSTSRMASTNTTATPTSYSVELWFKTNTSRGGKLIGYGNQRTGASGSYDRHVYMLNDGRVRFGAYSGAADTITSPDSYRDNEWHHMVATQGSDGMKLYVDGTLVASNPSFTVAEAYRGYWRIGGDNIRSWPDRPTSDYFAGSIDEVAIYDGVLTAPQVANHRAAGQGLEAPTAEFSFSPTDLQVAFDASSASTPAGRTITGYSWSWGDGTQDGTGKTPTHAFSASGTYSVTLTITDSAGLVSAITKQITVESANQLPNASFTASATGRTVSVNASESSDPDGSIVSYGWNWGDGSPEGSGATASHIYPADGTYTVTVTVTDNRGGVSTTTRTVTVAHAAPTAVFSIAASGLVATADASASTATDGATLSYGWNWGDGSVAGSGASATHTYTAAGTYTVTLTLTDSLGSTSTRVGTVTVATVAFLAQDGFERSVASGWGSADVGGTWSALYGAASAGSVSGGKGVITLAAGNTRNFALQGVPVRDSVTTVQFTPNSAPSVGGRYVGVAARQSSAGDYTARVWLRSDATLWLVLQRSGTVIAAGAVSGTWASGDTFTLKTEVSGVSPTTIRAKVWKVGASEPANWQYSATDSTAALQQAGYPSVHYALGGAATSSASVSFDGLQIVNLQAPAGNAPPVASFSSQVTDLAVAVDGSASSDSDGSVASYSWNWGDNSAAGSGASATHTYAAPGTYTVTLTVTDNGGATNQITNQVTVTAAPVVPSDFLAQDGFERSVASGWGSADVGGTWSILFGSATSTGVEAGKGVLRTGAGETRNAMLTGLQLVDVDMRANFTLDQAPSTGNAYAGLVARYTTADNYTVRAWLRSDGTVWLVPQRGSTVLAAVAIPGLTRAAGETLSMRVSVTGSNPTTIQAKIWKAGEPEPEAWQVAVTDSTPSVQGAGAMGVHAYRSGATTPAVFSVDDFSVQ